MIGTGTSSPAIESSTAMTSSSLMTLPNRRTARASVRENSVMISSGSSSGDGSR